MRHRVYKFRVFRFGRFVQAITGTESGLLKWIRDNVPAQTKSGYRSGSVMANREHLYEDARALNYTINQTVV